MNQLSISTPYKNKAFGLGVGLLTSLSVLGIANTAHAIGFSGDYAPTNWTLNNNGTGGSVDTSGAPNSISITSGDIGLGGDTDYTIAASGNDTVSFSWSFSTVDLDGPNWDPFGYLLNGNFFQLSDNNGSTGQNGSASFNVSAGDIFGFRANTRDGIFGPSTTTISNFSVEPVPEPVTILGTLLAGSLGVAFKKKQQSL